MTESNSNKVLALMDRAEIFRKKRQMDRFYKALEEVEQITPQSAREWERKGFILRFLDKYDKALDCYKKAASLEPNKPFFFEKINNLKRAYNCDPQAFLGKYIVRYDWEVYFSARNNSIEKDNKWSSKYNAPLRNLYSHLDLFKTLIEDLKGTLKQQKC